MKKLLICIFLLVAFTSSPAIAGEFQNFDKGKDTDVWALAHNYVSVVPVQYDLTHYTTMKKLKMKWEK